MEDFENTQAVLTEWVRVVKPGGVIALYVPYPDFYSLGGNTDHKHPGFRIEELEKVLKILGCDIVKTMLDSDMSAPQCPRYSSLVIESKR